jgi:two-component system cell cycle sensor histidine kinase PleC
LNLAQWPTQERESLDAAAEPSVLDALHCLRIAITVFDAAERLVFVNEHFNYLFRSLPPHAELIGLTYEELIRLEIAGGEIDDRLLLCDADGFVAKRRSQLLDGDYHPRDVALADGRIVEIKARRTASGGWIALWTDVTAARHVLGRLQNAIALSADAFAFFDSKDRLVLCNGEYAELHGARAPEDLIGQSFRELVNGQAKRGLVAAADGADAWIERRLEIHGVPAGAMTVEMTSGAAYLIRDRATDDGGRVVVLSDVTEHRRIEKTFTEQTHTLDKTRRALAVSQAESDRQASYLADLAQKLDRAAAEADTTKTTLLRTMSHELKTPLNAIIGFSDLLDTMADRVGPEQVKEYAGLIHQGGKNLLRLINQILDLTKISAGRYELRRTNVDAGSLLWLAKDAFETKARKKNIVLDADDCPAGLFVCADETALTAMAHHLIENAVNFTQDGGVVRLCAARNGPAIEMCVRDNGPGVAREDLERILLPFEQGGRATTDHSAGAGLGLTLVKAFCDLHGGALKIESAAGQGFSATIELPAAE